MVDRLAAIASGNPFALGEYIRSLLDLGMLRPTTGAWVVDATRFHELALPSDVIDLLIGRLATLGDEAVHALSVGALIGLEFPLQLATTVIGRVESVQRAMNEAIRANLVEPMDGGYRFVHDRVRESLLRRLGEAETREHNQRIADALDGLDDPSATRWYALARHYTAGHISKNRKRLFEVCRNAGSHALAHFSNTEAFELLERALQTAEGLDRPTDELATLREQAGIAAMRTGRQARAHEYYRAALEDAREGEQRARLHFGIGQAYQSEGKNEAAWQEIQNALAMLGAGYPKQVFAQRMTMYWFLLWGHLLAWTGIEALVRHEAQRAFGDSSSVR